MKQDATHNSEAEALAVGRALRVWRAEKSMTQRDIATLLGISAQQYQKYESGASGIELSRLFEMCRIFDKSPSDLLQMDRIGEANRAGHAVKNVSKYSQTTIQDTEVLDSGTVLQVDISFQISEMVSEFLAIKNLEDRALAIQIVKAIARK